MSDYHSIKSRPRKSDAIRHAIAEGFRSGHLQNAAKCGISYYTLGGTQFTDIKLFYNVFAERLRHAFSYENSADIYQRANNEAHKLKRSGQLGELDLRVIRGDIFESNLSILPRDGLVLVLFLDLTELLLPDHERFFRIWVVGRSLRAGDVMYVTSCVHPWLTGMRQFRMPLTSILMDHGATQDQLLNGDYWKRDYVPNLFNHFTQMWSYRQLSKRGFCKFFTEAYRDTKFDMAINGFVVT